MMNLSAPVAQFLSSALQVPWAMEPRAFDSFLAGLVRATVPAPSAEVVNGVNTSVSAAGSRSRSSRPHPMVINETAGMAVLPIVGTLLDSVPDWMGDATGYDELLSDIATLRANPRIKSVQLVIDSPGGHAIGASDVADALHMLAKEKRVTAETRGLMASAAYFLGSQAHEIVASPDAIVGSIGTFTAMLDASKFVEKWGFTVHRVASGPLKGAGMFGTAVTPEHIADTQRLVDELATNFKSAVARGRRQSAEKVATWATGEVWLGQKAMEAGLVDRVARITGEKTSSPGVPVAAAAKAQEAHMTEEEKAAAAAQASREAVAADRQRAASIQAAFPKDPTFAADHIVKGSTLAEAKAEFNTVLEAKNAKLEAENEKLKAAPVAQAVPAKRPTHVSVAPIATEGTEEPAAAGAEDFVAVAHKVKADRKLPSIGAAMSVVAKERPELYTAHLAKMRQRASAVEQRKRDLAIR